MQIWREEHPKQRGLQGKTPKERMSSVRYVQGIATGQCG